MIKILEFVGLNDSSQVTIVSNTKRPLYQIDGITHLLGGLDSTRFGVMRVLVGGVNCKLNYLPQADLVVNSVGDPECCQNSLRLVEKYVREIKIPIINPPALIKKTRKDIVFDLVGKRSDIVVPKTIRIAPRKLADVQQVLDKGEMNYPFLFEEAGQCEDASLILVSSPEQIVMLERFAFDGRGFYMTEFLDYKSSDGLYRKYRFYMIGDKVYPGFLTISKHWRVGNDSQAKAGFTGVPQVILQEEKSFLNRFQKKRISAFDALSRLLELDYFAIDCSFDNQYRPILFGISCHKPFLTTEKPRNYYNDKIVKQFYRAVQRMIQKKLQKTE